MKAKIAEIFVSFQGEGIYLGKEQIFIRFYGCNLNCKFCDTRLNSYQEYKAEELLGKINSFKGKTNSVSLTGGEPLIQKEFLKQSLPLIKQEGYLTYLETNATLPEALREIIDYIDIIAMDFKFPSSTGLRNFWQEHEDFLKVALEKETFVKAVICNSTDLGDLDRAVKLLSNFNRNITFILQPNSFESGSFLMNKIKGFRSYALEYLSDVRLIPQMHKLVGIK